MNTDIYSNIILHIRDVDSLVSLYLTNITFQQLLNTRYIYTQLAKKFNIVADINNFNDFMNHCGNFMSPPRFLHHKANKSGKYFLYDICVGTYKVIIEKSQVTIYEIEDLEDDYNIVYKPNPLRFITKDIFLGKYPYCTNVSAILLHIDDTQYVFIGFRMYMFLSLHKITNFTCLIGITSYQKPYTLVYAIDEYNNIYLFLEFVIINADRDVLAKILDYHDVYDFYYKIGDRCKYSSFMMIESLTE